MAKKHTTEARAAKVKGRFGWELTDDEANGKAMEPVNWRRVDSGNLARLATAMERIAGYLGRLAKAAERESERL